MSKKVLFCILVIIIILAVAFLGQNVLSGIADQTSVYMAKGTNWLMSNIYPKITDQLQNGGEVIQNSVDQAEKNISKNISDAQKKIENYFSGIKDAVLGKETQQENTGNCPCPNP